ncbi:RNA-directed DNA polymerase, eukaryota [Tanacetum coccineum]
MLWDYLHGVFDRWEGETLVMGDFNEVRKPSERYGSVFNKKGTAIFNSFITSSGLLDIPLDGYSFTWAQKDARKMSKLDCFLVSEGLMSSMSNISGLVLDRHLSDHRPILLREVSVDYGPTPFQLFHSWFMLKDFDRFVTDSWNMDEVTDDNAMSYLKKKLQALKKRLRAWTHVQRKDADAKTLELKSQIISIDKHLVSGNCGEEMLNKRKNLWKELWDLNMVKSHELYQKAKV